MTTKEIVSLEKSLLPDLPSFAIKGPLMFVAPAEHLLRGISFEGSSFDKASFAVTTFVMPLCVPTNHLYLNFGNRVRHKGGGDRWTMGMPNLVAELGSALKLQAVPFLSRAESLLDFVEVAKSFSGNPHTPKVIAFALARAGQTKQAVEVLDQLLSQLDLNVAWQREISDQAKALRSKLVTNPIEAQQQLDAWEAETVHNLGLDDFVVRRPIRRHC
ncbi:MAG TPA: hypothetical protein VFG04_07220 [Planctomycetaceae bacterium]|jgi:hypothetical protein|nr:hypothetical protein [Planctomycetaceae bacterium]